ncbi:hypothetical protein D0812_21925 [Vibrio owensii]|uniref:Uncharacterized protein n=1 Tax=Vibrio owensii TaxID=696485 RepID=A0AAP9GF83_9VIBR|nr:hypothetical protein [Vibrio owensii]AYO17049.1 hypothetical protein D0812_21925 [Vibrio owensii]QGH49198.1 hypothetical protein APZ19_18950 [Vibrio owensii]
MPKDYEKVQEGFIAECEKQDLAPQEAIKSCAQLLMSLMVAAEESGVTIEFEGVGTVQVETRGAKS